MCVECGCFFQAEDGIRDLVRSRGLGDVYKRQMHEGACRAAFAASCAEEQGKFWEMDEVLYQNQKLSLIHI